MTVSKMAIIDQRVEIIDAACGLPDDIQIDVRTDTILLSEPAVCCVNCEAGPEKGSCRTLVLLDFAIVLVGKKAFTAIVQKEQYIGDAIRFRGE